MPQFRNRHISEIIDIEALGELFQHLSNVTAIATALLDLDGNILIATNWRAICTNFHRLNPETAARCSESDTILAGKLEPGQKYRIYRCKNGLIDIAVPIVIDETHLGNLFTGQLFFEEPDMHYFEQQALAFGFDREAYLEALAHVPVFTRDSIEEIINLLCKMAQVIGEMGLNKLRLTATNKDLLAANTQLQREISERQEAERSGRESEERYRTLFNTSRDAMVIMIPGAHFIDANPAALELFGCRDLNEFTRKTPADLSPEYQPDGVLTTDKVMEVRDLTLEKGSHFFEWKHLRPNGEEFYVTVLLTRMQLEDKTVLQGTIRDVTASRQAEEELTKYREHLEELVRERTAELDKLNQRLQQDLRRREEAENRLRIANRELEAFAYTVSHDLRTPLTPIIGYAHFLRESCRDRLDDQTLACLDEIGESGEKMVALMEDLLTLARVGHVRRPVEPLNTRTVVNEVVCGLGETIAPAGVTVVVGSPPPVRVPQTLLSQIFDNLIGNAVRYAGRKGSPIEIGGERKDDRVRFYVRDHGPGVPEQERERIFEVFYRSDSSQKTPGTGVGLATVQKIARLYGGQAWVEETAGGGSTFWVEMVDAPPAAENEENSS